VHSPRRSNALELSEAFLESEAFADLEAELQAQRDSDTVVDRSAAAYPTTLWQQTWILLARRQALIPASAALLELLQVGGVACALSLAFAHSGNGEEYSKPLRDMEWLFCTTTYIHLRAAVHGHPARALRRATHSAQGV
jgi:hypothetical protein